MSGNKNYILDAAVIEKKLSRLALEVIENNIDEKELIFVGIADNGTVLAKHIKKIIEKESGIKIRLVNLTMNKKKPEAIGLSEKINFDEKIIIIIDDVANSGKTLLYALKPFLDYHPKKVQTLVLVERSHTLFPISADYKGLQLSTTLQEHIYVEVEGEKITGAYLD
ncbi:MAG: phosphoribosyltransferase [Sphingobacteriales bacterium 41-5]|nr:MAG: phosphoribosyltransferase [Sphingobacteriales bacterium 41-5]